MTWFLMKYMLMFGGVALAIYVIGRALFGQQRTDDTIAELEHQALDAAWRKVFQHGAPTEEVAPSAPTTQGVAHGFVADSEWNVGEIVPKTGTDPMKGPVMRPDFVRWCQGFKNAVFLDGVQVRYGDEPAVHFRTDDALITLK
jgi:hypothetical protein